MAKIKNLSQEDLVRWRMASADKELADNVFPGLSVEEGRKAILNYYKLLGDLLEYYDLNVDDGAVYVSPIDGGVYRLSSIGD